MMDVYSDTRQMSLFAEDMVQRNIGRQTFVAGSAPDFSVMVKNLIPSIVDGFVAWKRRQQIESQLFEMSDHMLSDIGVVRGEIRTVARNWAIAETKRNRAEGKGVLSGFGDGIVDTYRAWSRRRQIENELYGLSDHMLADINVRRNQIPIIARRWVAAEARRDHVERAQVRKQKAAKVLSFDPVSVPAEVPMQAANDDTRTIAA